MRAFLSDGISTIPGIGTTGAAIGGTNSWSSITTGLSPGVPPLLIAGTDYAAAAVFAVPSRLVFRVAPRAVEVERSIIEPIAGSPRRTWNPVNAPAHSVDSTMVVSQTMMPPAGSLVSVAVCMAAASPVEHTAVLAVGCRAEAPAVERMAVSAVVTAASVAAVCMAEAGEAEVTGKRICVRGVST